MANEDEVKEGTQKAPTRFVVGRKFGTKKDLENDGAWVVVGEGEPTPRVKIRRTNYPPCEEYMRKISRKHAQAIKLDILPNSEAERVIINALAEHLIVKWEGFWDEARNLETGAITYTPQPYSSEIAKKLLKDNPDFRKLLWEFAQAAETFRQEEDGEDRKN